MCKTEPDNIALTLIYVYKKMTNVKNGFSQYVK